VVASVGAALVVGMMRKGENEQGQGKGADPRPIIAWKHPWMLRNKRARCGAGIWRDRTESATGRRTKEPNNTAGAADRSVRIQISGLEV